MGGAGRVPPLPPRAAEGIPGAGHGAGEGGSGPRCGAALLGRGLREAMSRRCPAASRCVPCPLSAEIYPKKSRVTPGPSPPSLLRSCFFVMELGAGSEGGFVDNKNGGAGMFYCSRSREAPVVALLAVPSRLGCSRCLLTGLRARWPPWPGFGESSCLLPLLHEHCSRLTRSTDGVQGSSPCTEVLTWRWGLGADGGGAVEISSSSHFL